MQVVNPRLFDLVKCGGGMNRSKYNQRPGRPGGNDFRNNRPQQPQRHQSNGMSNGGGYQRQSRFSNAPTANAYTPNANPGAAYTTRPAMATYQSQNGSRFDAVAPANGYGQPPLPKQSYQQYQNNTMNGHAPQIPVAMYTAPPPAAAQFNYPPPILPVKN